MEVKTPLLPPPPDPVEPARAWHKQEGEPDDAWQKFLAFRDSTRPRRIIRPGVSNYSELYELARRWRWHERVGALDRHLQAVHDKEIEACIKQDAQEVVRDYILILHDMRETCLLEAEKLLAQSKEQKFTSMKPADFIKLVDTTTKLDRLIRGESTDKVEKEISLDGISIEELRMLDEIARRASEAQEKSAITIVHPPVTVDKTKSQN